MCKEVDVATSSEKSSKSPRVQLPPPAPPLKVPDKVMAPPKRNSTRIEKPLPKAITDDDAEIVEVELSDTGSSSSDVINAGSQQPPSVGEKAGNAETPQPNEDEPQSQVILSQTTEPKESPRSEPQEEIVQSKETNDETGNSQENEKIDKSKEKKHESEEKPEKSEEHGGKSRHSDEQSDADYETTSPYETTSSEEGYEESYSSSDDDPSASS